MKKDQKSFEDDGRTIVPMDFDRHLNTVPQAAAQKNNRPGSDLSRSEMKEVLKGSLKASLLVAAVITAAIVLFVLFCTLVWFR